MSVCYLLVTHREGPPSPRAAGRGLRNPVLGALPRALVFNLWWILPKGPGEGHSVQLPAVSQPLPHPHKRTVKPESAGVCGRGRGRGNDSSEENVGVRPPEGREPRGRQTQGRGLRPPAGWPCRGVAGTSPEGRGTLAWAPGTERGRCLQGPRTHRGPGPVSGATPRQREVGVGVPQGGPTCRALGRAPGEPCLGTRTHTTRELASRGLPSRSPFCASLGLSGMVRLLKTDLVWLLGNAGLWGLLTAAAAQATPLRVAAPGGGASAAAAWEKGPSCGLFWGRSSPSPGCWDRGTPFLLGVPAAAGEGRQGQSGSPSLPRVLPPHGCPGPGSASETRSPLTETLPKDFWWPTGT